jgi:hypothetical protein
MEKVKDVRKGPARHGTKPAYQAAKPGDSQLSAWTLREVEPHREHGGGWL